MQPIYITDDHDGAEYELFFEPCEYHMGDGKFQYDVRIVCEAKGLDDYNCYGIYGMSDKEALLATIMQRTIRLVRGFIEGDMWE